MRYRLRTLLIVLALGPPVLAISWVKLQEYREYLTEQQRRADVRPSVPATKPTIIVIGTSSLVGDRARFQAELAKIQSNPGSAGKPKFDARAAYAELERERDRYLEQTATTPESGD
jgi:hypothetical protein